MLKIFWKCEIGKFICGKEQEMNKPTFVNQPYDIEAHEGTTIELPCQGESNDEYEVIYSIETLFKKNTHNFQ